jgi:transcriptional regulator GlxA family with amidase domain
MAIDGSNMQRIAHVIHILKTKFSEPVRVEDLAEVAHMSRLLSTFISKKRRP